MEWMNFLHDAVDFSLLLLAKLFFRREFDGMKKFFHFNIWIRNGRRTHLEAHTYTYIQKLFIIDRINSSLSLSLFRFLKKKNELEWMNPFVAYRENLMQWWRKISDFVNRTSIEFISRWRGFFTTDIWCWWMFLCLFLFFSFTWALNLGLDIDWQRIFCYPCQLRLFGCHGFYFSLSYPHYFPSCGCLDDSMYSYLSVWCINPKRLLF